MDLQDGLLLSGFVCLEAGVGVVYWPAALILAGILFFIFSVLIQISKSKEHGSN